MGIVEEIVIACKDVLDGLLTGYSRIPYEHNTGENKKQNWNKKQ